MRIRKDFFFVFCFVFLLNDGIIENRFTWFLLNNNSRLYLQNHFYIKDYIGSRERHKQREQKKIRRGIKLPT